LVEEIFAMYEEEGVGNSLCKECREKCEDKNKVGPFSFFHIGKNFQNDEYKVLFVGKNTWFDYDEFEYLKNEKNRGGIIDVREIGAAYLKTGSTPFWDFILEITRKLYDVNYYEGTDKIAITNMMKCNISNGSRDKTPDFMKECCIEKNKIIQKEIEKLKPKHVIFFTGSDYDDYIEELFGKNFIEDESHDWKWKEKEYKGIKMVITYHPGSKELRKNKNKFINFVVEWIKPSEQSPKNQNL
jgi:hypothetical protein